MVQNNIKLIISYDGTDYKGFQSQVCPNTIEDTLKKAINIITGIKIPIYYAGRTDTGVHADGQVVNFFVEQKNMTETNWFNALNSILPKDIRVLNCVFVSENFHARKSCLGREYWYQISNSPSISALINRYTLHYLHPLNVELLQKYCDILVGEHDFTSFCSLSDTNRSKIRNIYSIKVQKIDNIIIIKISGKSFLHHMIRIIIGTLLKLHRFELPVEEMKNILEAKDRKFAGPTYSSCGLIFKKAYYDKNEIKNILTN